MNDSGTAAGIWQGRQPRPIRIEGDIAYVPLTQGHEAVIDAADVPLVRGFKWRASVRLWGDGQIRSVYAVAWSKQKDGKRFAILMHRLLASTPSGLHTDHADGNGLNNRRENLRAATCSQNQCNRRPSPNRGLPKGVCWSKSQNKWVAKIRSRGVIRHLGTFASPDAAAAAYAKASTEIHGSFGRIR